MYFWRCDPIDVIAGVSGHMGYGSSNVVPQTHSHNSIPIHPDVRFKHLPFYDKLGELIKPSSLGTNLLCCWREREKRKKTGRGRGVAPLFERFSLRERFLSFWFSFLWRSFEKFRVRLFQLHGASLDFRKLPLCSTWHHSRLRTFYPQGIVSVP